MTEFFFCGRKMFHMVGSKGFNSYFYNHNKNLYNKFACVEMTVFVLFKIVLEPYYNC